MRKAVVYTIIVLTGCVIAHGLIYEYESSSIYLWGFQFYGNQYFEEKCSKVTAYRTLILPVTRIQSSFIDDDTLCTQQKPSEKSPKLFDDLGCVRVGTLWKCRNPPGPNTEEERRQN